MFDLISKVSDFSAPAPIQKSMVSTILLGALTTEQDLSIFHHCLSSTQAVVRKRRKISNTNTYLIESIGLS